MNSFREIIFAIGLDDLARAASVSRNTCAAWRGRDSIPARYWPHVLMEVRAKRIKGVTREKLIALAAGKQRRNGGM